MREFRPKESSFFCFFKKESEPCRSVHLELGRRIVFLIVESRSQRTPCYRALISAT